MFCMRIYEIYVTHFHFLSKLRPISSQTTPDPVFIFPGAPRVGWHLIEFHFITEKECSLITSMVR